MARRIRQRPNSISLVLRGSVVSLEADRAREEMGRGSFEMLALDI